MLRRAAAATAALVLLPAAAAAQDGGVALAFTLGAGVAVVPDYFGSDELEVGPNFAFDLGYVGLGPVRFGSRDFDAVPVGFGLRGSFRYVPEREGAPFEAPDRAFETLDASIELGGGVRYAQPWYDAFALVRYGVTGHESLVGEVGLDLIARPTSRLALRAGPRLLYGSDDYADYYFGGATDTDLAGPRTEAEGGLLSSGVAVAVSYRLTDAWGLGAIARFDRLQNDAAESAVTAEDNQFSATLAVTRRFTFEF